MQHDNLAVTTFAVHRAREVYLKPLASNSIAGDFSVVGRSNGLQRGGGARETWSAYLLPNAQPLLEAGEEAFNALTNDDDPADDHLTCVALLAAQRAGIKIAERCAIIDFGDYAIADKLYPSLTTIRRPATEIGAAAAQRILELVGVLAAPENSPAHFHLQCELIERESS